MSLTLKTNPVGVDKKIDQLQRNLFSKLIEIWKFDGEKYKCTPRCYRNQKETGYVAELFVGLNDYEEVYYDDRVSATSFFGLGQTEVITEPGNMTVADVHLIFSVNAQEVKPIPANQRNDEEIRIDVQSIIDTYGTSNGWIIKKITSGLDKILTEYPGSRVSEGLKYKDMHPFLWFRFDMQLYYQPTLINCKS